MSRDDARKKTVDILFNGPNADFYASLFENYNFGDPENTPISPVKFGHVNSRHNVVITEEAYRDLLKIRQITNQTNGEVAFLLIGEEKPNGTIWLDTVLSTYQASSRTQASFKDLSNALGQYVRDVQAGMYNNGSKPIVCHGHTHGTSRVADNFSFGDMISYVQFNSVHPMFQNRQIETMGMLMPPSGDFNFIMFENNPQYEGFYTFPTVYLRHNDGRAQLLPAYQNGNYLVNQNNQAL